MSMAADSATWLAEWSSDQEEARLFEATGEVRPARPGEFFLDRALNCATLAPVEGAGDVVILRRTARWGKPSEAPVRFTPA